MDLHSHILFVIMEAFYPLPWSPKPVIPFVIGRFASKLILSGIGICTGDYQA